MMKPKEADTQKADTACASIRISEHSSGYLVQDSSMVTYTVTYPNKSQQYSKNFNFVHQVMIGGSWFEVIPLVPVGV